MTTKAWPQSKDESKRFRGVVSFAVHRLTLNWERSLFRHGKEDAVDPEGFADPVGFHLAVGPSREDTEDALHNGMLASKILQTFPAITKVDDRSQEWGEWTVKVREWLKPPDKIPTWQPELIGLSSKPSRGEESNP